VSAPAKPGRIEVRHCHGLEEWQQCAQLEKAVWGFEECVPLPLYVVAAETGGQVLGAFLDGELVGFTLAVAGVHSEPGKLTPFLHSHMTAVRSEHRDRGIGRQLKLFQRQDALARGIRLVEWTFDPLEMRNAHFNLMRLGAVARRLIPNCYGITSSEIHFGLPTDRLVAQWYLDSPRVVRLVEGGRASEAARPSSAKSILIPEEMARWRKEDREMALIEQARITGEFHRWFAQGYVATAIENTPGGGAYLLEPFEQVKEELDADS
jgi:predicted GNAT superfamily acetyltransferase